MSSVFDFHLIWLKLCYVLCIEGQPLLSKLLPRSFTLHRSYLGYVMSIDDLFSQTMSAYHCYAVWATPKSLPAPKLTVID